MHFGIFKKAFLLKQKPVHEASVQGMQHKFYSCSFNSFTNLLYKLCNDLWNKTIAEKEFFILLSSEHVTGFTIKLKSHGIKIKFYDPDLTLVTNNIVLISPEKAKSLSLNTFIDKSIFVYYGNESEINDLHLLRLIHYKK